MTFRLLWFLSGFFPGFATDSYTHTHTLRCVCFVRVRLTIGVELLRRMGWKEGQGVGPRVKRRARRQQPGTSARLGFLSLS